MKLAPAAIAVSALVGTLWFGTEESYLAVQEATKQVAALEAAGEGALKAALQMRGGGRGDDPWGLPSMMSVSGDTGIISIKGSLVNGSAGFFRLFGLTGYEDIKAAITEALEDKNVKRIVLDIDSPGGAVNGLEDAGEFVRKAALIKPVVSFTGGTMASAAYWLGVSADSVFAARTAMAGSVGTMIVVMERSEQMEKEGIKAHIFRHGKYKALGHPLEKMTAEGKEHFQYLADASGKIFVEYAAERRGTTPEKFQKTMGEGRVFMGDDAHDVGLVDGIMSFDSLLAHAKTLDKKKATAENSRHSAKDTTMKLRAVSKAVILAIAGGTAVEALGLSAEAANVEGVKPDAEALAALQAEAAEIHGAFAVARQAAVDAAVAAAKAPLDKVVADLTAKVALLEAGAADLTAKAKESAELAASFTGVLRASIATMSVALGATDNTTALQGKELLAAHDALADQYKAKFKAGGVAAVTPATKPEGEQKGADPMFLATLGAFAK